MLLLASRLRSICFSRSRCAITRESAKHSALHKTRAARIVIIKRAAGDLAGGEKAAHDVAFGVHNLPFLGDLDSAESEGDAASDWEGVKWRRVQTLRPIRLNRRNSLGTFAVSFGRIEENIFHRVVKVLRGFHDALPVQAGQFFCEGF